jgi:hypothetical protein
MAFLRKFLVELIVVAVLVGWAVAKFPEILTPSIPWLCLTVFWHLTWELARESRVSGWLKSDQRRMFVVYIIAFVIGGAVSTAVVWSAKRGAGKLAILEGARERQEQNSETVSNRPATPLPSTVGMAAQPKHNESAASKPSVHPPKLVKPKPLTESSPPDMGLHQQPAVQPPPVSPPIGPSLPPSASIYDRVRQATS